MHIMEEHLPCLFILSYLIKKLFQDMITISSCSSRERKKNYTFKYKSNALTRIRFNDIEQNYIISSHYNTNNIGYDNSFQSYFRFRYREYFANALSITI